MNSEPEDCEQKKGKARESGNESTGSYFSSKPHCVEVSIPMYETYLYKSTTEEAYFFFFNFSRFLICIHLLHDTEIMAGRDKRKHVGS